MGARDFQLGFKKETVYNTPVTVDRFHEYVGDVAPIKGIPGRTNASGLRVGTRARRAGRTVPYFDHGEGTVEINLLTKGFGFFLEHMLPSVATTGSGPYTHTATEGGSSALMGKSFTTQMNYPLSPSGTNQPVTFSGGKVPKWSLSCEVGGPLVASLDLWFASMTTATVLATASYASDPAPFVWSHGVVTIGGTPVDLTSLNVEVDQGMGLDSTHRIGTRAEPKPGELGITWELTADFSSLTQWNRVHSTTISGMSAEIEATFTNGTDVVTLTLPAARFDDVDLSEDGGGLMQVLKGEGEGNGTDSPITLAYTTSDATP